MELVWAFQEITGVQINFDKCEYTTNNKDIEEIKITKTKKGITKNYKIKKTLNDIRYLGVYFHIFNNNKYYLKHNEDCINNLIWRSSRMNRKISERVDVLHTIADRRVLYGKGVSNCNNETLKQLNLKYRVYIKRLLGLNIHIPNKMFHSNMNANRGCGLGFDKIHEKVNILKIRLLSEILLENEMMSIESQ